MPPSLARRSGKSLATDTLKALAVIALTGLLVGGLVHTLLARSVVFDSGDAHEALGLGPMTTGHSSTSRGSKGS